MQSQFSTSNDKNRNISYGDSVGVRPCPDKETTRGMFWLLTQNQESTHFPENDLAFSLPPSPPNCSQIFKKGLSTTSSSRGC